MFLNGRSLYAIQQQKERKCHVQGSSNLQNIHSIRHLFSLMLSRALLPFRYDCDIHWIVLADVFVELAYLHGRRIVYCYFVGLLNKFSIRKFCVRFNLLSYIFHYWKVDNIFYYLFVKMFMWIVSEWSNCETIKRYHSFYSYDFYGVIFPLGVLLWGNHVTLLPMIWQGDRIYFWDTFLFPLPQSTMHIT